MSRVPGDVYNPTTSTSRAASPTFSAALEVANIAVASFNSYQMDKIRYQMEIDAIDFQRAGRVLDRQRTAWTYARNKDKMKEAMASEELALSISSMQQRAAVQNAAVAANVSNASSVVRDVQRDQLRSELYQERTHLSQLESLKVEAVDSMRNTEVLYDPNAPEISTALAEFGIGTLDVGRRAFEPVKS